MLGIELLRRVRLIMKMSPFWSALQRLEASSCAPSMREELTELALLFCGKGITFLKNLDACA
jgi:hypothetical protein